MSAERPNGSSRIGQVLNNGDLVLVMGLFGALVLLILPVVPFLLDSMLAVSIGISLLILMVILYVRDPVQFSAFPTILLFVTLFRLALNVASTRLILTEGYAGNIIESFGEFVVKGNYVVGAVVFLILVIINFIVITKGAGRIAEVTARFTLDAMPGRQMSIDAELNAGIIDEATAKKRRKKIQDDAEFYGAMDGASKFVRGDAIAGILIVLINVIGGFAVGIFQRGMSASEALQRFTLLSIGDGLVTQIPALLVSVAAGVLVTRATSNANLGVEIGRQLIFNHRALAIVAGILAVFGLLPGMPMIPFFVLAGLAGFTAYSMRANRLPHMEDDEEEEPKKLPGATGKEGAEKAPASARAQDSLEALTQVESFSIELGYGLVGLADRGQGGDLLDRVTGVRKNFAREMGIVVPPIAISDSLDLEANGYRFLLRGKPVASGEIMPRRWLAMNVTNSSTELKGVSTVEPVFGLPANWITEDEKTIAETSGFTVVDAASVLITHLSETFKGVAHLILGRQDVQGLVDHVKQTHPAVVNELIPDLVGLGVVQRVLQNLLKEGIPVKNLPLILECIADFAPITKNPDDLSEQVRRRLGVYFIPGYESEPGVIRALTLDPRLEHGLIGRIRKSPVDVGLAMDPPVASSLLGQLTKNMDAMIQQGMPPVLVTTMDLRLPFRRFFEASLPKLVVLGYEELPSQSEIRSFASLTAPAGAIEPVREPAAAVA